MENIHYDEDDIESIPFLPTQERYEQWIENLAKHELEVIIDDQVDPDLPLRETVDDVHQWLDGSGTLDSFDYHESYYAIQKWGGRDGSSLEISSDEWRRDPQDQMWTVGHHIVVGDVASELNALIEERDY